MGGVLTITRLRLTSQPSNNHVVRSYTLYSDDVISYCYPHYVVTITEDLIAHIQRTKKMTKYAQCYKCFDFNFNNLRCLKKINRCLIYRQMPIKEVPIDLVNRTWNHTVLRGQIKINRC